MAPHLDDPDNFNDPPVTDLVTYGALPVRDRILVRRDEAADKVAGGLLYAPDEAKPMPLTGTVLAVGPGRILDNGYHLEMDITVGARVMFGKFSGTDVELNGEQLLVLREDEVILVLKEVAAQEEEAE